jgi:F-type H+-transporting ATPase subunit b
LSKEKEEAETKYQDIEKRLRDFDGKKKEIVEQFQKEGQAEKERIIAEAHERAKQIVEQAELTIQQEMQSAKDRLRKEVMVLAADKAQETIAKEMTDEDQDRLVSEFIERVGKIH